MENRFSVLKKLFALFVLGGIVLSFAACGSPDMDTIQTEFCTLSLNEQGYITKIIDKESSINYVPSGQSSPLLSLYDGKEYIYPNKLRIVDGNYSIVFENQSEAIIEKELKDDYVKLTLASLSSRDNIVAVVWGPYATSLSQYIGETIGVVRDTEFAIGVQALEINTIEGLPHLGDDARGRVIIDPLPGQTVPDELKDMIGKEIGFINVNEEGDMPDYVRQWRGFAAEKKDYGSDIHLFSKDWRTEKVIDLYGRKQLVEALDTDFIGSSIALFGCPAANTLDVIEHIELTEGLPHPMIDGVWVKRWDKANQAYMFYEGTNVDRALDYADSCNFTLVHIGDFFKSWGHFDLTTKRFPGGAEEIKALTDKARERGISLGVHTLTMFTSRHDPYVSPVPSDSLCKAGSSVLTQDISATDNVIYIEDPTFFTHTGLTRTVKIGKELIAYKEVSPEKPYHLTGCIRGQFGTQVSAHKKGDKIDKLVNDDYSGFFPDIHLQDAYADRLAAVCEETGIDLMDFDGYGGGSPTGHGAYGAALFVDRWYKNLDQYRLTCGAGTFHYYWHIYTFMNWGEPWYDNLRQSQVNYRLDNQRYFERNLMPGMLGWFKLEQTYRPEDIEWIQARSAAFDAGYLLRVDESIEVNGFKSQLFESIREWQKVRNNHLFTQSQLEKMKNPRNEFHLQKVAENEWDLYDIILQGGYEHKHRLVQSGEPLQSKFKFENEGKEQPVQFYLYILNGEESTGTVTDLEILVNNEPIAIQGVLKDGDKLYCDGEKIYVCDSFWNSKTEQPLPAGAFWKKGNNDVIVRCTFSTAKAPVVQMECKALGDSERIRMK